MKLSKESTEYKKLLNYTDSSLPMKLRKIMVRNMLKQNKDKTIGELILQQELMDKSYKEQRPLSDVIGEYNKNKL
jgi:hypothetical protein